MGLDVFSRRTRGEIAPDSDNHRAEMQPCRCHWLPITLGPIYPLPNLPPLPRLRVYNGQHGLDGKVGSQAVTSASFLTNTRQGVKSKEKATTSQPE